jgi:hypothetical protein
MQTKRKTNLSPKRQNPHSREADFLIFLSADRLPRLFIINL